MREAHAAADIKETDRLNPGQVTVCGQRFSGGIAGTAYKSGIVGMS